MTIGKSIGPIGAGIKDSCEPTHMGAEKWIKVLSKNIMYSKQMSYLQPFQIFITFIVLLCFYIYTCAHVWMLDDNLKELLFFF